MTQLFTGIGLGLQGSSLGLLGSYGPKGSAGLGQGGESVYVNGANGNLVLKQSDGFLAGPGLGLDLFQVYNSRGEKGGAWRFNTDTSLQFEGRPNTAGSVVKRRDEDGHCSRFIYDEHQKTYLAEDGTTARLTFRGSHWQYREGVGQKSYNYNKEGQLTSLSDRDGHEFRFSYQEGQLVSITDTSGKQSVTWSFNQGLLRDVTWKSDDQCVHHLHYEYDASHRLSRVSRDLGNGKTYWITYDYAGDSNLVSGITQSDGTQLHIDYDTEGRVKRLLDGEGRITTYTYLAGKTIVTNGLGEAWTYSFDSKARLTGIDGPANFHARYHYEANHLASITQGNQRWQFVYNEAGDCIRIDAPDGGVTRRTFDEEHRLLSETQYQRFDGEHHPQKPLTKRFVYDEQGHLRFELSADGTVTEYRYDHGLRISSRSYLRARISTQQLADDKNLSLKDLIDWTLQQSPNDVSLVDYRYDWRGNPLEEIHYLQVDDQGQGVFTNDALRTYSRYDAAGRLVEKSSLTDNGMGTTHYFYDDLGRLIKTIDNQQNEQTITYDDAHQRIIKTDANGLQTIYTYDQSGLLLSKQSLDSGHSYGTVSYQYDAAGRLVAETGLDGKTSYTFFDEQGRVQATVTTSGQVTAYEYDDEGRCIQTHHYQQALDTHHGLNLSLRFDEIKPQSSSQDRITQVVYNEYNQLAYQIDAEGAVIAYQYDAEGRVISKTAYANRLKPFLATQRLTVGRINVVASSQDRIMMYYYDAEGRLEAEVNGEGFATGYRYDLTGHLIDRCHYANKSVLPPNGDWIHDAPLDSSKDIHTYSLYNAAGLKIADIDAERFVTEYRYDARGLLTDTIAYYVPLSLPYTSHLSLESLRPEIHVNDHHTHYRYNDLNQLIEETHQTGLVVSYAYDANGLLVSKTSTDSKTQEARQQRYRYDALGRIIQSLDALGAARLEQGGWLSDDEIAEIWNQHGVGYTYDNAGRLLSKTNAQNQTSRFYYNDAGLLTYTLSPTGSVTETRYNAFEEVETTVRYSACLVGNKDLTTEQIRQYVIASADARFDEVSQYEYNTLGRLMSKRQGVGGQFSMAYNAFGELEQTTQTLGLNHETLTDYQYDRRGLLRTRLDDVGGINKSFETQYDAFGRVEKTWDGRHGETVYILNKRGEAIRVIDPGHGGKTISYDAFGRVLSVTDKTDTNYTYDDQQNTLTLERVGITSTVVTQFNAFGDTISVTDARQQTTTYQYDAKGQLIHVDAPDHQSTDYRYDAEGLLVFQQNASGHLVRYSYDADGRVLTKQVDPDGLNLTTTYTYDGIGRQLQVINQGRCTQFRYDSQGHLVQIVVDPDGLNLITELSYTEQGLLSRKTTHNQVIAYEWDALGRCLATSIDPDGLALTTRYDYDNNDNLIAETDANQQRTQFIYDANHRVRYSVDPRGVVTEHCYGIRGIEKQTITYAHRVAPTAHYDEASLKTAIQVDTTADHYQFFSYDNQNRLISSFDGMGFCTFYAYDKSDNLVEKRCYANPYDVSALKVGGRGLPQASLQDRITRFAYNASNQIRFQIEPNGQVTEYRYDASGQLIKQVRFANALKLSKTGDEYVLGTIQKNLQPSPQYDETTQYTYDMAGRLHQQASPSGVVTAYQYNDAGNVIATTQYATKLSAEALESDHWFDNLKTSTNDRTTRALYDAAGRERYRISATGKVIERRYDAVGNVLAEITYAESFDPEQLDVLNAQLQSHSTLYEYDVAGRLLTKTDAADHRTSYTYDHNNNVLSQTDANQSCWMYRYDEANQLIDTLSPKTTFYSAKGEETQSIVTQNSYDSFGNLVSVIRDAEGIQQTVHYTYDSNHHLLETIYPHRSVNQATQSASAERQEALQTLTETHRYNAFGELIASRDRAGHWRHWAYDNQGRMAFSVDTENNVTQYSYDAFDNLSKKTTYAKPLSKSPDVNNKASTFIHDIQASEYDRHDDYVYDKDHDLIESRKDAIRMYNARTDHYDRLSPTTKRCYNAFGEVVKQEVQLTDTEWAVTRTYYNLEGLKTATVDAEGYLTTYTYNAYGQVASDYQYADRAAYTDEDYTPPKANSRDREVTFVYDALGQLTSKTLKKVVYQRLTGNGSQYETICRDLTSSYGYDALGHLVSTTDPDGNTAYSYYNASGQLTATVGMRVKAGRTATTYRYDALGQLLESRQWAGGAKEADASHFILADATNQDVILSDRYDEDGHLIQQTDGTGHQINYSYDANGNIARCWQVVSHDVIQDKRYRYDKENHLIQSATIKANGALATDDATYNAFGEVVSKGIDGVMNQHIDYDKAGRVWRSNTQGSYQIYVYDLADRMTQLVTTSVFSVNDPNLSVDLSSHFYENTLDYYKNSASFELQRQDHVYDGLGRLLYQIKDSTVERPGTGKGVPTKTVTQLQVLDRFGNVLAYTNANGYTTHYEYNAFDQVVKQILPEVKVVDEQGVARQLRPIIYYAYDALGRAIAMTDGNGHTVAKVIDANGQVTQEIDALGYHRDKNYNLLGQLTTATNERGGETTYIYDKANRLLSVSTAQTWQGYAYDGAGQLIQQTDGRGNATNYGYDALGHQISREQAGMTTTYDYDDAGHKILEKDAKGNTMSWLYDQNGRLQNHTDMGGQQTDYVYNTNGQILSETSTRGKNIHYEYIGDGSLIEYYDKARQEIIHYTYDAEGHVASKRLGDGLGMKEWVAAVDHYEYDALGRLVQLRRTRPEVEEADHPNKDDSLLWLDYEYDAAGNIRDTKIEAHYTGYPRLSQQDYFRYDANNRMLINKGQLINGQIKMTASQGSELGYDETGNINKASKYESGILGSYTYRYNTANQLEVIRKNNIDLQTKRYDKAGHIEEENLYNNLGVLSQHNVMSYSKGVLTDQLTTDGKKQEVSRTHYDYDEVENLTRLTTTTPTYTQTHQYTYELWDSYQQKNDTASLAVRGRTTTAGKSEHFYDINGQLKQVVDAQIGSTGQNSTTDYMISNIDGLRYKENQEGKTSYLSVAGQTIGDLQLTNKLEQHLEVYGGFTPVGKPETEFKMDAVWTKHFKKHPEKLNEFLEQMAEACQGILPEAPQDNLGSYTLQSGDTLESIALQVYGDSSLWYLLADANGITDRNAHAGEKGSQLHPGQRLNIPPAASGQHYTNGTHKVLKSQDLIGNTSATTPLPPAPPAPKNHTGLLKTLCRIFVAAVAVVITVMSAGALALMAAGGLSSLGAAGLGGIIHAGLGVLGGASTVGGAALSATNLVGSSFAGGFIGSIAAQGASIGFKLQKGIDFKDALIAGLATAATAGTGRLFGGNGLYKDIGNTMDAFSPDVFSIKAASEMIEKDALNQSINLAIRPHQHFDWLELGINAATAGIMGGLPGQKVNQTLNQLDHNTGILTSELQSITTGATTSAATNTSFNPIQTLTDNLGNTLGSSLMQNTATDTAAWNDDVYDQLTYDSELFKAWDGGEGAGEEKFMWSARQGTFAGDNIATLNFEAKNLDSHFFQEIEEEKIVRKAGEVVNKPSKLVIKKKDLANTTDWPLVDAITDEEFTDKNSLSKKDIRRIIEAHNPDLLNEKNNADEVIYQAAQNYEINPKALLATLQQEQNWGRNGIWKAMGVGLEGRPKNLAFQNSINIAAKIYRRWFDVGFQKIQMKDSFFQKLNDDRFSYQARTAGEYSKLKYTPWTYYGPQGSRPYDQWVSYFRGFK